jgi:hypothetical protein
MMLKLKAEDPNSFRKVMCDLEYQGKEPAWFKQSTLDNANSKVAK